MAKRWEEIASRLPDDQPIHGVEVGVGDGTCSEQLLRLAPMLTLVMVDRWAAFAESHPYRRSGDQNAQRSQRDMDAARRRCQQRTAFAGDRAVMFRSWSNQAARLHDDQSQDFVFLDGDSTRIGIESDLRDWWPKVKPGGFLCGHHYGHPQWPQQAYAVDAFAARHADESILEAGGNMTWFLWRGEVNA